VLAFAGEGYDFRTRLAHCEIVMFRLLDGVWRRFDTVIRERCHRSEEVEIALHDAGFAGICRQQARDLGMDGQIGHGREFWIAVRS
jgi:hypothetical protein